MLRCNLDPTPSAGEAKSLTFVNFPEIDLNRPTPMRISARGQVPTIVTPAGADCWKKPGARGPFS